MYARPSPARTRGSSLETPPDPTIRRGWHPALQTARSTGGRGRYVFRPRKSPCDGRQDGAALQCPGVKLLERAHREGDQKARCRRRCHSRPTFCIPVRWRRSHQDRRSSKPALRSVASDLVGVVPVPSDIKAWEGCGVRRYWACLSYAGTYPGRRVPVDNSRPSTMIPPLRQSGPCRVRFARATTCPWLRTRSSSWSRSSSSRKWLVSKVKPSWSPSSAMRRSARFKCITRNVGRSLEQLSVQIGA